ncbi:MAG: uroporphyrinogen-III synthase [Weeksellaceae bacterium]
MTSILFTKQYPEDQLQQAFSSSFVVDSYDFIESNLVDIHEIQQQIPTEANKFIVTSIRATKHIESLSLKGEFYVVGETSETYLKTQGKQVAWMAEDAASFLEKLKKSIQTKEKFVYFCSQIRKDKLPDGVRALGHHCLEIVTYKTELKKVAIQNSYDGYVFFSPSGVKSFAEQYNIPEKAVIFAIGETTGQEVRTVFNRTAMLANSPTFQSLIRTIKAYFDAEK